MNIPSISISLTFRDTFVGPQNRNHMKVWRCQDALQDQPVFGHTPTNSSIAPPLIDRTVGNLEHMRETASIQAWKHCSSSLFAGRFLYIYIIYIYIYPIISVSCAIFHYFPCKKPLLKRRWRRWQASAAALSGRQWDHRRSLSHLYIYGITIQILSGFIYCKYICICVCTYIYNMDGYIYIYVYIHIGKYPFLNIYLYIHTHIYIYIYMHIYIYIRKAQGVLGNLRIGFLGYVG